MCTAFGVHFFWPTLYIGLWARGLMPCLCRDFAVIFAIFTKSAVFFTIFCRDFLLSLVLPYGRPKTFCPFPDPTYHSSTIRLTAFPLPKSWIRH